MEEKQLLSSTDDPTLINSPTCASSTTANRRNHRRHSSLRPSSTAPPPPEPGAAPHRQKIKSRDVRKHKALKARVRKLSSHETLFPTPEAAKAAFEAERAQNPLHRRAPTPYTSRASLKSQGSDRSIASRVSFDSTRSRSSAGARPESTGSELSDYTVRDYAANGSVTPWEERYGTPRIGPAGEAIEVIGLGRKKPRHRAYQRNMLKPALRSSQSTPYAGASQVERSDHTRSLRGRQEIEGKPLPRRPTSIMGGVVDTLRPSASRPAHSRHVSDLSIISGTSSGLASRNERQRQGYQHNNAPSPTSFGTKAARSSAPPTAYRQPPFSVLGSLFSSLSIDPSASSNRSLRPDAHRRGSSSTRNAIPRTLHRDLLPAESLHTCLALVRTPGWTDWPPSGPDTAGKKNGWLAGLGGMMAKKGFHNMGQEWHRRFVLAEQGRMGRVLRSWEGADKYWEKRILDCMPTDRYTLKAGCDNNVPNESIPDNHRWGSQIFALPAEGFQTVEFYDEASMNAGDYGLLSFLTGSLLQTAVSAVHMLRYSSAPFSFHLLPAPIPANMSYRGQQTSPDQNALWEGFGTLALVNKDQPNDRAMIIQVRPPDVMDGNVLREFAKKRREWWHLIPDLCVGDAGQANLLQAQVYDDCYQNQVHFFAVTNLKYWVFGHFDPTWTVASVSPVLHRQMTEPSIMQCLVSWLVRSVDERPQAVEATHLNLRAPVSQQQALPPYTHPRVANPARPNSHDSASSSFSSLITPVSPTPTDFSPWGANQLGQMSCGLPNYWDVPHSPSATGFAGYNTWSPMSSRPYSPPGYGVGDSRMWCSGTQYPWGMR